MKNKKQFTLIELIIVIVVIGILAAMALPKFNGVVRNAKLTNMINDKEVLEKALTMYYQKNDKLPLLNEDQELIVSNDSISLTKIVLAEEAKSSDMDTIYKSLKETLTYYKDSEETLYRIDLSKIKDNLSKDIKYGHKKNDKDFFVYSTKTGKVYYYDYLVNGNGTIQHSEYDTLLKDNELLSKVISPSINKGENSSNNKPIIELTTNLDDITPDSIINWEYTFADEDPNPTKISFILNEIEYDSFDKIPKTLNEGEYTVKLKMQDSKGLLSNEIIKSFIVKSKINIKINNISLGAKHSIKIGEDGDLYTWGYNGEGQLGIGNLSNKLTPQKVIFPNGEKPISISSGCYHSMIITDKGNLYSWGDNKFGQLGIGNTTNQTTPQLVTLPNEEKPISISLGIYHSAVLTNKGNLYSWGYNNYGQLGIGNTTNQTTPQLVSISNEDKFISVLLGGYHSMAITNKGDLYVWGYNGYGQLGIGNTMPQKTPQLMTLPNNEKLNTIKLGCYHSMAITNNGNLYVWGNNEYGQLGIGSKVNQTTPQLLILPNRENPTSIALGYNHSMVITDNKSFYVWGSNNCGQLGLGSIMDKLTPQKLVLPNNENPIDIYVGGYNVAVTTNTGKNYIWGRNLEGQLGIGNTINQLTPIKVDLP